MTKKITSMFSRLAAQFLKPTLALLAALVVGGAWAAQHDWQGVSGTQLYWEDSASWSNPSETTVTEWIINVQGAKVGFRTNYADNYVAGDTAPLVVLSGNTTPVEFTADDNSDTYGLTKNGPLDVSAWWQGNGTGSLKVNSGTYSFTEINVGRWNGLNGELAVVGGTVIADNIYVGLNESGNTANGTITVSGNGELKMGGLWGQSSGSVTINGGKITATKDNEWFINGEITFTVGANGGTIDTNGKSVTIIPAIAGSGTLRIVGGGSVIFSTAPTCTVAADADTTVTGAGDVASTAAVAIVAPSADWSSKTLPTTAGVKTVTSGNWATYSDGGASYQQTLGSDTAYVSIVNIEDSAGDAEISGVKSSVSSSTTLSGFDVYTIVNGTLLGAYGVTASATDAYISYTGNTLTCMGGNATVTTVAGAGCDKSKWSTMTGNAGVVIEDGASVRGSIVGSWIETGSSAAKLNGNTAILVKSVLDTNGETLGDDRDSKAPMYYIIGGGAAFTENGARAPITGNTSITVSLGNEKSGTFAKAIVGGTAQLRNHTSAQAQSLTGSTSIIINAPNTVTFSAPIIGGGFGVRKGSSVSGNANILINGGTFTGAIYAGGWGIVDACTVAGDATITINGGVFSNAKFYGSSASGVKTLAFNGNVDVSSCTISGFDKITVSKGVTVTISASQASMFTAQGLSVEENAGVYTATYVERYYWTPGTTNANWDNPENWRVGDDRATTETAPGNSDTVEFPATGAPWTVTLTSAPTVAVVIVDGNVTFSGAQIYASSVTGTGTVTLAGNAGFHGYDYINATLSITANLNVTGTGNKLAMYGKGSGTGYGGGNLSFTGDMTGNGEISIEGIRSEFTFSGNWQTFSGTVNVVDNGGSLHRNGTRLNATKSSSALAKWNVYNADNRCFVANGATYEFGELTGVVRQNTNSSKGKSTIKVGALDTSFALTYIGNGDNADRRDTIIKAGTGTMTLDATYVDNYQIEGGCLLLTTDGSLPTVGGIVFKEDGTMLGLGDSVTADASSKISVDSGVSFAISNATERTFATAIGSGTSGGFTKKGAGTLTLSQPPTYTGTTKVEDGVLYVINGDYTLTLDSGTAEVTTDKDGYRKFVPASVTIAAPMVVWGNDFETATISAAVTSNYGEGGLAYNLKIGGNVVEGAVGTIENGVVTFSDVDVSELSISPYGNVFVEVTATAVGSQAVTSGATTAMLADAEGWIDEKKSTTGTTGSWKDAVTYGDDNSVQLSDNKFSATNCSTGDVVTVTIKDVIYKALSDTSAVDADAQGSVALGGTESAPKFMVLTKSNDTVQWSEAAGVDPALNTSYTIVFTFDYNSNKYSITVNEAALTVGGSATYDIVKTTNKYVKDIDFLGAGSIKAIEGIQYDAMMAVDQDGVRYATVAEALDANKGVKGAIIKLLHGTSNTSIAGWRFDEATRSFIKKAMGMVFLAF